ncbi:alcohol dehydrogenase catalytic domain-containing protein [Streptomyces sp. NPDC047453]|uniref:alcohol dehydrogenase catalytic domain-containing protein n=1 Tax=Streptomyces sp. NPDC047453 TaxID=3154812 RepID=UPI0033F04612
MTKRIRVTKRGYIRNSPLYGPSIRGERGSATRSLPRTTPRSGGKRLTIRGAPGGLAASTPTNGRTAFVTGGRLPSGDPFRAAAIRSAGGEVPAGGICLSNVHVIDGSIDCPLEEVTPGHEPAGTIAEVGARVPYWQPGRRVVIAPGRACDACPYCGDAQECLAPDDGAELGPGPGRGPPMGDSWRSWPCAPACSGTP